MTSMSRRTSPTHAFTLIEIVLVVALVGLLALIAIPNVLKARTRSQTSMCISNLRQIHDAKQQWALELHRPADAEPLKSDIAPYLGRKGNIDAISCPAERTGLFDNSYNINQVTNPPSCKLNEAGVVTGHRLE